MLDLAPMIEDFKQLGNLRHSDIMVRRNADGRFLLIDGAHRVEAMKSIYTSVRCAVFKSTLADSLILSYSARILFLLVRL